MMHRDTMLKFDTLFDLAKYLAKYGRWVVAPTLNFRTPSLSRKLVELGR